jgi:hypothetical protein
MLVAWHWQSYTRNTQRMYIKSERGARKRKTANLKISYILRSKNIICGLSPKERKPIALEKSKKKTSTENIDVEQNNKTTTAIR